MNCLTVTTYLVDAKFATFTPIDSVIDHALDVQYCNMHPSYRTPQIMALLAYLVQNLDICFVLPMACIKSLIFFHFLESRVGPSEDPTNSFIPRVNYGREYYVRLFALRMLPTVLMESSSLLKTFKCRKQIASLPTVSFFKKE